MPGSEMSCFANRVISVWNRTIVCRFSPFIFFSFHFFPFRCSTPPIMEPRSKVPESLVKLHMEFRDSLRDSSFQIILFLRETDNHRKYCYVSILLSALN